MTGKFLLYSSPVILVFVCLSVFEPAIYWSVFASSSIKDLKGKEFLVIAHRGASGVAPENTLAAIQKALDLGVDMIELDVRNTKNEEIIVFHDQTLDRTTNGTGDVHDYTLEEIKQLDAGAWFAPQFTGERVPTLKEVLDLINGRCKVLIEIKHMDHPHYDDFAKKLIDVIRGEKNGFEWCILQSYEDKYLEEAHHYSDSIQTKKLLIGEDSAPLLAFYLESRVHLGRSTKEIELDALNPHYETLSPRRVFRMHARGFEVYAYPVNEREDMIKCLNMGVDGIITDYPSKLIALKAEIDAL